MKERLMNTLKSFVRQSPSHCASAFGISFILYAHNCEGTHNYGRHKYERQDERPPGHHVGDGAHESQADGVTRLGQGRDVGCAFEGDTELLSNDV